MKELLNSVSALANQELTRANKKFPQFSSPHEAYGVLREEIEEHEDDTKALTVNFNGLWSAIKSNSPSISGNAKQIKRAAIHAAAEAIQVAAMAQKTLDMLGKEGPQ